ncbi:condensation domain-containing protein, partial [Nocardiopsis listeri]|uniref:condensation domain-containing protein n=1 Tax=Nocardiopsis listeri TaxID=53440 RepID=UPI001CC1D6CC
MPLNQNGKVDRKALPAPERAGGTHVAPRTDTERVIADEFASVLGVERVGVHDDFFALGGDSILAARLLWRLDGLLGTDFGQRALFRYRTPEALAAAGHDGGTQDSLPRVDRGGPLPLSAAQRRLWFLHQIGGDSAEYYTGAGFRIRGRLSPEALRVSLTRLQRKNEALRTTYDMVDGEPVQLVRDPWDADDLLSVADLTELSESERDSALDACLLDEVNAPFDLVHGPVNRALLVALTEDEHILVLSTHHIACDGWSVDVMARDLAIFYRESLEGNEPGAWERTPDYADFAVWEQTRWSEPDVRERLAYWARELEEVPPLAVPTDRPRPSRRTSAGAVHRFTLSREQTRGLHELGREQGATLFMSLTAMTQLLLAGSSGSGDVALGIASSGRDHREVGEMVGFFVNPLVIRSRPEPDATVAGFLGDVRDRVEAAFEHELPFDRVVDEVVTERDPGRGPLFQALMVLQNAHTGALDLPGLDVRPIDLPRTSALSDLVFEYTEQDGGIRVVIEYNTDLFDRRRILGLAGALSHMVSLAVAEPERTLATVDLRSEEDRAALADWSRNEVD